MSERFYGHPELQATVVILDHALVSFSKKVGDSVNVLLKDMNTEIEKRPEETKRNAKIILTKIAGELKKDPNWREFLLLYPKLNTSVQYLIVCHILFGHPRGIHEPIPLINHAMFLSADVTLDAYFSARAEKAVRSLINNIRAIIYLFHRGERPENTQVTLH